MLELLFHAGAEHPNLAWVIIPSVLTFVAGLLVGRLSHLFVPFQHANPATDE